MSESNRSCCCGFIWCDKKNRFSHAFPNNFVVMTNTFRHSWLTPLKNLLNNDSILPKDQCVWIGHFAKENIQIQLPSDDDISDALICVGIHNRSRLFSRGASQSYTTPLPDAAKDQISMSWFAINPFATYSQHFSYSTSTYKCLKTLK